MPTIHSNECIPVVGWLREMSADTDESPVSTNPVMVDLCALTDVIATPFGCRDGLSRLLLGIEACIVPQKGILSVFLCSGK